MSEQPTVPISPDPVSSVATGLGDIADAVQAKIDSLREEATRKNTLAMETAAAANDAAAAHSQFVADLAAARNGDKAALQRVRAAISGNANG